jgi:hypothetical protein
VDKGGVVDLTRTRRRGDAVKPWFADGGDARALDGKQDVGKGVCDGGVAAYCGRVWTSWTRLQQAVGEHRGFMEPCEWRWG